MDSIGLYKGSLTQASFLTLADSKKSKNACGGNGYHNSG